MRLKMHCFALLCSQKRCIAGGKQNICYLIQRFKWQKFGKHTAKIMRQEVSKLHMLFNTMFQVAKVWIAHGKNYDAGGKQTTLVPR